MTVALTWSVEQHDGGARLKIAWRETGGPSLEVPAETSFGLSFIEHSLSYELEGEVSFAFEPPGFACDIDLPIKTTSPTASS